MFSKFDGKCTGKFHSYENILRETSFLNCVISWDPASGRAELEADTRHVAMVFRDLGLEKSSLVVTLVAKRPKSGRTSDAGRSEVSERRGFHVVPVSYNVCKLLVSGTVRTCDLLPALWHEK